MSFSIVDKILIRKGHPGLLRILSDEVSGTELNSLLLEVYNQRAAQLSPATLLKQYQLNRFVKPADLPVLELKRMELDLLEIFQQHAFEPLELSPVSAFGSCSVVGTVDQKKIISAIRGTEVLADATNAIALHIADIKQQHHEKTRVLRFGTIQRHVRTQQISGKGFTPHFKIGCLVTAGYDSGNYVFEKQSLSEHITILKALYLDYYQVEELGFRLLCRPGAYPDAPGLARNVKDYIVQIHPEVRIDIIDAPPTENNYYEGIQYKVDILVNGQSIEIGDGGFVDWTQQLLQNRKERMLSTGIGFDLMYRIKNGLV